MAYELGIVLLGVIPNVITHNRAHRVPSGCNVLLCMQCVQYSVLCASSHQRGGRKLPRTVRVSYRLNGLPALWHT